jgi:tetratricopeptide (TPR) repeat protein
MELGRLYFLTKKYDQSAHYFSQVYQALENPTEFGLDARAQKALLNKAELAYQLFGESFLEGGKPELALLAFEKANQIKADEALSLYNRARVEAKQKQPAQALAKLETYLDKHYAHQGTGPYMLLAEVLTDLGQSDQLLARLEKARSGDAENIPLSYFLAQRYLQADQLDKAAQTFSDLLERRKARPPLEAISGMIEVRCKQKDAAGLLVALGEGTGRIGNLSQLGQTIKDLVADAELTQAVIAEARRRLDADPDKVTSGERLAAALLAAEIKDFATAGTLFDLAAKANPAKAQEVFVTWGLELFVANQYAETIAVFRRGLDEKILADDNATLHYYLAGALEMNGRTDEALAEARRAAELQKDSPRLQSRVAWIEYHAKRYDAARQSYQALLDRFDKEHDSPEAREVMRDARLVLSNIAVLQGKLPESEEWLEQVLDEFPEDVGAQNDLGYLWADAGKHLDLALQMIQYAVSRDAKNTAYRDSLGWVLYRLGRYPEAVAELKAAAASSEAPDGTILDHLAEALLKSGDKPAAIEAWQRAAEHFDKHEEPDKAQAIREKISSAQSAAAEK